MASDFRFEDHQVLAEVYLRRASEQQQRGEPLPQVEESITFALRHLAAQYCLPRIVLSASNNHVKG
jgi:hypothetical protein